MYQIIMHTLFYFAALHYKINNITYTIYFYYRLQNWLPLQHLVVSEQLLTQIYCQWLSIWVIWLISAVLRLNIWIKTHTHFSSLVFNSASDSFSKSRKAVNVLRKSTVDKFIRYILDSYWSQIFQINLQILIIAEPWVFNL